MKDARCDEEGSANVPAAVAFHAALLGWDRAGRPAGAEAIDVEAIQRAGRET